MFLNCELDEEVLMDLSQGFKKIYGGKESVQT